MPTTIYSMAGKPGWLLKFERAHEHFTALDVNIRDFLADHPYEPVVKFNPENMQYGLGFRIKREPPPEWSILIGECLYNFRSSLDHLVWQLACDYSGNGDPKTQFPVFLRRDKYWKVSKKGIGTDESGLRKVCLLDPGAQAEIDGLQPYNRPDGPAEGHPLWLLQNLRNEDEHRLLHVVGAAMGDADLVLRSQDGRPLSSVAVTSGNSGFIPFNEETDFIGGIIQSRAVTAVQVEGNFSFGIAFREGQPARYLLSDIATFVSSKVFPALTPFLKA